MLVLPFGPLAPAFVGLVKFLGVSSVLLRVFLIAFIFCVCVTIVSIRGGKYDFRRERKQRFQEREEELKSAFQAHYATNLLEKKQNINIF